jgi:hypothetical protein
MIAKGELIIGDRERFSTFVLLLEFEAPVLSFEVPLPGII